MAEPGGLVHQALTHFVFVASLALAYMGISSCLITFNKFLMHHDAFPFAIGLGTIHMIAAFFFNMVLLQLCPSMYPSLTDPEQKVTLDRPLYTRVLLPIAVCFATQLVLSNMAFMHSSVTMLQMMKQSNVVLVYLFSLALSLETFCRKRVAALALIFTATILTVHGDVHFSLQGFTLQGISMLCESFKLTLQSYSLSAGGRKLDPFTYVTLVAPLVLGILLAFIAVSALLWPGRPEALTVPPWEAIVEYRYMLVASGCLAFAWQIAHAAFIKNSSAITFILTGVVMKDVLLVTVCAVVFGEDLSMQQIVGFSLQLTGVLAWSLLKMMASPATGVSVPPLPHRSTGLIAAFPPDPDVLRSLTSKVDDCQLLEPFKRFVPRTSTNGSESTAASRRQDDSDEEFAAVQQEELEGI